ncbi:MAG: hypothetical protein KFF73_12475 [Cyclobacteriaceae bacterium]|nr:hypothetical protein [Cyclobacteriaceae bacterium]
MNKSIVFPGLVFLLFLSTCHYTQDKKMDFPSAEIGNEMVTMHLYLPDPEKGFYRATRFDWSGIISSVKYHNHEYFGYWKKTHDPMVHEDLSGPAESYNKPGLGYEEATPGGQFIRIGIGILEKPDDKPYETFKTYRIVDHGNWSVKKGRDWITFEHEINSDNGYGYVYTKKIELKKQDPGFTITHHLTNTGTKKIETDQYNHNFFIIDGEKSGPAISIDFPYDISTGNDLKGLMKIDGQTLIFTRNLDQQSVWMELSGYGQDINDHRVTVRNNKTGAGVNFGVDRPLYRMVFWACGTTYCPENFILISVEPGQKETWVSDYTFMSE